MGSKRQIVVIAMIFLICLLLGGCTRDDEFSTDQRDALDMNTHNSNSKIDLTLVTYHIGEDTWADVYAQTLDNYREQNPHLNIIDNSVPASGDIIRKKIKTDFVSDNEPDICFFFTSADAKPLVESGKLFSYDEELEKDREWSNKFLPTALDAVRYTDGKIYAIPTIGFYEGLFCNVDLFDKYNLELPKTYDDLKEAVNIFNANGITPIANSIFDSYYLIETFILSAAGPELHNEICHPTWATGIDYIKELYQMDAFPKTALTMKEYESNKLFIDKKAAMLITGSWLIGQLEDQENVVVLPLPLVPNAKAHPNDIIGGFDSGWYITKEANEKKNGEPLKLVKHFTSPEIVTNFIAKAGVPALKDIEPITATPIQKSGYAMFMEANSITSPIDNKVSSTLFSHIRTNLAYIVEGRKTSQEVLEEAQTLGQ